MSAKGLCPRVHRDGAHERNSPMGTTGSPATGLSRRRGCPGAAGLPGHNGIVRDRLSVARSPADSGPGRARHAPAGPDMPQPGRTCPNRAGHLDAPRTYVPASWTMWFLDHVVWQAHVGHRPRADRPASSSRGATGVLRTSPDGRGRIEVSVSTWEDWRWSV